MKNLVSHFLALQASLPAHGPGFSALILRDGETVLELHHGLACLELGVPLTAQSRYYLASESKQFTAACVLDLVRRGTIGLDDDVASHLPEVRQFGAIITVRQLLNHTSGIPDYFDYLACQLGRHDGDYFDNALLLRLIARMDALTFPPGSSHAYSNCNYILLAKLVEVVSGQPLATQARERLFAPLGMHATAFDVDRQAVMPQRVRSYTVDPAQACAYRQHLGNANTVGDGGVYASLHDLVLWERDWQRQYHDPASLVRAQLAETPGPDGQSWSYRFGLEQIEHGGRAVVFHDGGLWGFRALLLRVPEAGLSVIQLANVDSCEPDQAAWLAAIATDLDA
ncbi:serine hydrolase domain-containing protein [Janthinobacterium sp. 75]|uniref:serine hydrolase domain-containing protein n=1 Tax=Janthinobacterium sp. 75 TaxID=2135628 RepID=UPI00106262F0|nr:serine hydrolase domain-containing protein [Janthinobacterium sp. 75]TDY32357.1 CubicO group peptidase (beta-lactamase class C family) [Janthinobacterium sp. 75]